MEQKCRRIVSAPALTLLVRTRSEAGSSGFVAIKPLDDGPAAANETDSAQRMASISGMDIRLSANPAMTVEAERELRELFGVPLSVRAMPGSRKECYKELDLDFEDE